MRIISLNTWGGRAGKEGLLAFFTAHAADTDVFCLQEIWSAPYSDTAIEAGGVTLDQTGIMVYGLQEIAAALPDFEPYFRPHHGDHYGLCTLVKKNVDVKAEGEVFVYKHKGFMPEGDIGHHARNIQFVTLEQNGAPFTIINFHGLWNGRGKGDSEERLEQSGKIRDFITTLAGKVVLCGDFNLLPDTESIKMLEDAHLRNLVSEYGVTSTRTSFYTKPEKFADYAFVSEGMQVATFSVLPDEVSDHAALLIDIK